MVALAVIVAGTIGNYADLESKVGLWLDRDDLVDRIPDFIALLEARLNRELRTVSQETSAQWVVSSQGYALPADFRKLRSIYIDGSPTRPLVERALQTVNRMYSGTAGVPAAYYITGRTINFIPPPNSETTFNAVYFTRIAPLTSDNDSNWLLAEHADIYLTGTLLEAAIYIRDEDAISFLSPRVEASIESLKMESNLDRHGGGPLVPEGARQVRGGRC